MRSNRKLLIIFVVIVGLACLTKVLLDYQWRLIWEALKASNKSLLIGGSIVSIVFYWLFRALRWQTLLRNDGVLLPFWQTYLVTGISVGSSTVTPFQAGEALKVEYLRKFGGQRSAGYATFLLERILDFLTVIGVGVLGVSLGFDFGINHIYFYLFTAGFLVMILTIVGGVFLFPSERLMPLRSLLNEKWKQKWMLLLASIFTVLSWLMVILGWKNALASVGVDINFLQASSLVSMTTLLIIISFVPGAVGVSEVGIAAILTKMGFDAPLAQTGAIAVRAYTIIILGLTLIYWLVLKFLVKSISKRNI